MLDDKQQKLLSRLIHDFDKLTKQEITGMIIESFYNGYNFAAWGYCYEHEISRKIIEMPSVDSEINS